MTGKGQTSLPPRVGILGPGRLGRVLAASFQAWDVHVSTLDHQGWCSGGVKAWLDSADYFCLAVRDDQLGPVAATLAALPLKGKHFIFHSGQKPVALLKPLALAGAAVAKLHPLFSFTGEAAAPFPEGVPFALGGNPLLVKNLAAWVETWQGKVHVLEENQWTLYHLAAVYAANFLPLFIRAGGEILQEVGVEKDQALAWLGPLVRQSVAHALDATNPLPYSGPAIRGDRKTMEDHETCLLHFDPELVSLYRQVSRMVGEKRFTMKAPD